VTLGPPYYGDGQVGFANFSTPFYSYAAIQQTVPPQGPYAVSIAGHNYVIDTSFEPYRREAFRHKSIAPQRQSINLTNIAGEGTVNTEGLWRREQDNWTMGAGQRFLDRKTDSVDNRFYKSKGIDPWANEWQIQLQKDVIQQLTSTWTKAISCGRYVFVMKSDTVSYVDTNSGWNTTTTAITGMAAGAIVNDICSNGTYVFIATDKGIYRLQATGASSISAGAIRYVKCDGTTSHKNNTFSLTGMKGAVGTHNLTVDATTNPTGGFPGVAPGMPISGTNIPSGSRVSSISSNGFSIKISNPIVTAVTASQIITFTQRDAYIVNAFTKVFYCNNTLVAFANKTDGGPSGAVFAWTADPPNLDEITDANDCLMIHPDRGWTWTAATGGLTQIYLTGYATNGSNTINSGVYRTSLQGPSVAGVAQPYTLNYPVQALPLPIGEYGTAIYAYLNFVFLGTNKGIRMCQTLSTYDPTATSSGDLKSGPVIPNLAQPVTQPVTGIVGDGRFIYFTWNQYDSTSTGLGRLDLSTFIQGDPLAPAYASDLMITGTSNITSLEWDGKTNSPLMSVAGGGIYTASTNYVSSGYVNSGYISYGIPDAKVAVFGSVDGAVDANTSLKFSLSTDDSDFYDVGTFTNTALTDVEFQTDGNRGELYQVQITLTTALNSATPILRRYTLKSYPAVASETNIMVVLQLMRINYVNGAEIALNPYAEYYYLDQLRRSQTIVDYVEGPLHAKAIIDMMDWIPHSRQDIYTGGFQGDLVVTLKTINGFTVAEPQTSPN